MIVYIAGPFRAETPYEIELNVRVAEAEALRVARAGFTPMCPHTMFRFFQNSLPDEFWLGATLELLSVCDAIYLCSRWEESSGTKGELEYAKEHNIPILHLTKCGWSMQKIEQWERGW